MTVTLTVTVTRAARPRGYILIFVLLVLLVLSLIVAALYTQSQDLKSANLSNSYAMVAAMNAARGAQEAIRALRNGDSIGGSNVAALTATCSGGDYRTNCPSAGQYLESRQADGGIIVDYGALATDGGFLSVVEGGGLQFSYAVYRTSTVAAQPPNRFTIQATGYAGNSENSLNFVTSVVEVEIELGTSGTKCVGYECG